MAIRIGNQTGGVINNIEGNQYNVGGQQGTVVTTEAARQAVQQLRQALASAPLDPATATAARAQVDEIDTALQEPQPDRRRVAGSLERLTKLLTAAGALATAGAQLATPLRALAGWLGTIG